MPRLLSSTMSDPIASAVNTFSTMAGTLDSLENNKQKRQLTGMQMQEEQMRMNELQRATEAKEKERSFWGGASDEAIMDMYGLVDAYKKNDEATQTGKDPAFNDKDTNAVNTAMAQSHLVSDDPKDHTKQAEAANYLDTFMKGGASKIPPGKHAFNMENAPQLIDATSALYGKEIDQGTDKLGLGKSDGVKKTLKGVYLDNSDPNQPKVSMLLGVESPVKDGQVFKHVGDIFPKYTVNPDAPGMTDIGNIDLSQRPVRRNGDGSVSTVLSMSFEDNGKEILVPKISDSGKILTDDEAVAEYEKTGKHLGKFANAEDADRYAETLHSDPMWNADIERYSAKGKKSVFYDAPLTMGRSGDPDSPIMQAPAQIFHAQVQQTGKLLATALRMRAMSDPDKATQAYIDKVTQRDQDRAAMDVLGKLPKDLRGQARADWLMSHKPEGVSLEKWSNIIKPVAGDDYYKARTLDLKERDEARKEKADEEKANKGDYKSRTRQEGDKKIFEESQDGGKTWKAVSAGPAFKPESPKAQKSEARAERRDEISEKREQRAEKKDDGAEVTKAGKAMGEAIGVKDINEIEQSKGIGKETKKAYKQRYKDVSDLIRKEHIGAEEAMAKVDKEKGEVQILKPLTPKKGDELKKKFPPGKFSKQALKDAIKKEGYEPPED